MHFGTVIIIGIAVNLDNLCLGLSCGMAKKHIRWYHNLIIALISGVFGGIACATAHLIPEKLTFVSTLIGSLILFTVGTWTIVKSNKKREVVHDCPIRYTSMREVCILSVVLAFNCLAVSFGMGMSDAPFLALGLSITAFSFIMVSIGNYLGRRSALIIKTNWLDIISGLLLIVIAVWEWLI